MYMKIQYYIALSDTSGPYTNKENKKRIISQYYIQEYSYILIFPIPRKKFFTHFSGRKGSKMNLSKVRG